MHFLSKTAKISLKVYIYLEVNEHNHTPRCSLLVSATGLLWLKHFRVQG